MVDIPVNQNDATIDVVVTTNGQVLFDFDWLAYSTEQVHGIFHRANGTDIAIVAGVDFTVAGLFQPNGGSITLTTILNSVVGEIVTIYRSTPIKRLNDYQQSGDYFASVVNMEEDIQFMIMQELRRDVDRASKSDLGKPGVRIVHGPNNSVPQWDANGNLTSWINGDDIENAVVYTELARKWAVNPENVLVVDPFNPDDYSSYHYSRKSRAAADEALAAVSTIKIGVVANAAAIPAVDMVAKTVLVDRAETKEPLLVFDASNLSAKVTADPAKAIYIPPAADVTGASGAWVRRFSGPVQFKWFSAPRDGVTPDNTAFTRFLNAAIDEGSGIVEGGILYLNGTLTFTCNDNLELHLMRGLVARLGSGQNTPMLRLLNGGDVRTKSVQLIGHGRPTFDVSMGVNTAGAQASTALDPVNLDRVRWSGIFFKGAPTDYRDETGDSAVTPTGCRSVAHDDNHYLGFSDYAVYYTGSSDVASELDDGFICISNGNFYEKNRAGLSSKRNAQHMVSIGDTFRYNYVDVADLPTGPGLLLAGARTKIIGADSKYVAKSFYDGRTAMAPLLVGCEIDSPGYDLAGAAQAGCEVISLNGCERATAIGCRINVPTTGPLVDTGHIVGVALKNYTFDSINYTTINSDIDVITTGVQNVLVEGAGVGTGNYKINQRNAVVPVVITNAGSSTEVVAAAAGAKNVYVGSSLIEAVSSALGHSTNISRPTASGSNAGLNGRKYLPTNAVNIVSLAAGAESNLDIAAVGVASDWFANYNATNFNIPTGVNVKVRCTTDLVRVTFVNNSAGAVSFSGNMSVVAEHMIA